MVKTKSVYDPAEESDGERILVTRYWPRGVSKVRLSAVEWMRDVSPSKELLKDWKGGRIPWEEYTVRYRKEMLAHQAAIATLRRRSREGSITLLCFEREGNPCCHRHLLKKLIEKEMIDS